jgi:cobalt-zinc-cadmium resistance protein CzcA
VDVSSLGGETKEYQIRLDPDKLVSYRLNIAQVEQQLANNNTNAGGSFIVAGAQQVNVEAVGLVSRVQDNENIVIKTQAGTALRVKDIAAVEQVPKIRLGQNGRTIRREDGKLIDNQDVVEGIVLLQKGDDSDPVLRGIEEKVRELNERILPKGVKVVPFLDRNDLIHHATHTVLHNLTEGIVLVSRSPFAFRCCSLPFAWTSGTIPPTCFLSALSNLAWSSMGVENVVRHLNRTGHGSQTPLERESGKLRMKYSGRFSMQSASSSRGICRFLRCRRWKDASSNLWRGPSPSPCWAR